MSMILDWLKLARMQTTATELETMGAPPVLLQVWQTTNTRGRANVMDI